MNQPTELSPSEQQVMANTIADYLGELNSLEALKVLNGACSAVLNRVKKAEVKELEIYSINQFLPRRRRLTKIDNDPELKAFILSLNAYHSAAKIISMCVEKFGKEREPSMSGLYRFIQSRTVRQGKKK